VLSVPKGGGAVRGIGEKFGVNPATGTGTMTVPVPVSPGRSDFTPALSLGYDSGHGNGPFGLGWQLALQAITRKTDRGVPRYRDPPPADPGAGAAVPAPDLEGTPLEDTFLFGAEDLVPVLVHRHGRWHRRTTRREVDGRCYTVARYRPRVDTDFTRVERWTDAATGDDHWRTITREGVTTFYGRTGESRVADPRNPSHVYSWLGCESYDGKGNAAAYTYKAEDEAGVDLAAAHERHRTPQDRSANRYVKRVRYGNRVPLRPTGAPLEVDGLEWLFEIVFDYGEHDQGHPTAREERPWPCRGDPFSSYRPGFEVRTYRLCRRILVIHHFGAEHAPDGTPYEGPVRALELGHTGDSTATGLAMLTTITARGFRESSDEGLVTRTLPPLELEYSRDRIDDEVRTLDAASLENLPAGLLTPAYRWVDLDGEGLAGVLTEQAGTWFYRRNLGDGRLAPQRLVNPHPHPVALTGGRQELLDLDGDGHLDLVELGGSDPGFSERTGDGGWTPWRPFRERPTVDVRERRTRFVDLNGDGREDILVVGDDVLTWFPSHGTAGFGDGVRVPLPYDERRAPRLLFSDTTESLHLADLTGDGLPDLVRVRNGEVCYWPSLGYGRFGAQVVLDGAPWLDDPDHFDPRRVRVADVTGSGVGDLVYLHRSGVRLYANRSGNSLAPARELPVRFPRIDSAIQVSAIDLLGTGTICLVWSSPLPGDQRTPLRYVDLLSDGKPHLLVGVRNNLGAQTTVTYAPSTRFYVADRASGRPWTTRAPFPVQVVERLVVRDLVAHNVFTSRFAYHDVFYDGVEREFGGFGMVEQWDAEEIGALSAIPGGAGADEALNLDPATHLPPVLTRSWFHTGARTDPTRLGHQHAESYHRSGTGLDPLLTDPPVVARVDGVPQPVTLTPDEARQAARALRGRLLRQEVYALDGTEAQDRPYSVTTRLHAVELRQPAVALDPTDQAWRPAVFAVYPQHTREEHHERLLRETGGRREPDPRVHDEVVLDVDEYLDVLRSVGVAQARRHPDPDPALAPEDRAEQARARYVLTEHVMTNAVDRPDAYLTPMPAQTSTYELTGLSLTGHEVDAAALRAVLAGPLADVPAADWDARTPVPARRLAERDRTVFRRDDLRGPLPFAVLEPLALPWETARLAFTPGLLAAVYGDRVDAATLHAAGYVEADGGWWAPSGRALFAPDDSEDPAGFAAAHFYRPQRFRDPFGAVTSVEHDRYDLLPMAVRDPVGNVTSAGEREPDPGRTGERVVTNGYDYRVLQPRLLCDANGNLTEVAHDALARVTATAVRGTPDDDGSGGTGDTVDGVVLDPAPDVLAAYLSEPVLASGAATPVARALLGRASSRTVYDPDAFRRSRAPAPGGQAQAPVTVSLVRDRHVADVPPGGFPVLQQAFTYSDGFARAIQHKVQADHRDTAADGEPGAPWIGTGWTVYDNKGLPRRRYEPFFTGTHRFEFARAAGVSTVLWYDPLGRELAAFHPDGSYEKRLVEPWRLVVWDRNDTVALDPATDPDVAGAAGRFLAGLARAGQPWRTWYARRADGDLGPDERRAARQTLAHAATPDRSWSDPLGRAFVTVRHNVTPPASGQDEGRAGLVHDLHRVRLFLDVQGRTRAIRDPLGRLVTLTDHDLRGNPVGSSGIDSGPAASLPDVVGGPHLSWNARGYRFRTEYDALHRPTRSWLAGPGIDGEREHQRTEYGEGVPDAALRNLRTQVHRQLDGAGEVTHLRYDVQGNLARAVRRLAGEVREILDWSADVHLADERLEGTTEHDALNRPVTVTAPDGSTITATYATDGLLASLTADLPATADAPAATVPIVTAIARNARGQRVRVDAGNGTSTRHEYDPETFLVRRTLTLRGNERVQDLRQVYDPQGNVTASRDDGQQRIFFRNRVVDPGGSYVYDALYRLVRATGREHLGQAGGGPARAVPPSARDAGPAPLHPNDGPAMARYVEHYGYDRVGNLTRLRHVGADPSVPGWTRDYHYDDPSLLEPDRPGNRLGAVVLGEPGGAREEFAYDVHGNVTSMPGLRVLRWDPEDRLHASAREALAPGHEAMWACYGQTGTRIRKVVDRGRDDGSRVVVRERTYLGAFERYREYDANGAVAVERTTVHVLDEDRAAALVETRIRGTDRGSARLVRHQLTDHLGSSTVELDQQARLIGYEEYHPYGSTAYEAVASMQETPKRYRYTGRERDEETGLSYHGARYYAPWLGRWTSTDPAGVADSMSPYVYVGDNPLRLVDPGGREGEEPRQLNLAETLKQEVIATRAGRGISAALRRDLQAVWEWWGGHGKVDAGHVGKPQVLLRAGERGVVAPQPSSENRSLGVLERVKAAVERAAGRFARNVEGVDPTVPEGATFGRTARAPWRADVGFRAWLRRWSAGQASGAAGGAAAAPQAPPVEVPAAPAPGAAAGTPAQLELPFGKPEAPSVKPPAPAPTSETPAAKPGGGLLGSTMNVLGYGAIVGDVLTSLHEGRPGEALKTAVVGGGGMALMSRVPALIPLAVMFSTIDASKDPKIQEHAFAAADYLGGQSHPIWGGVVAATVATGESLFQGTFGRVGRALGQGAAVLYIRATSDEYTIVPWKTQIWSDVFSSISISDLRMRYHH
jgi:RHS repeat-associated protein